MNIKQRINEWKEHLKDMELKRWGPSGIYQAYDETITFAEEALEVIEKYADKNIYEPDWVDLVKLIPVGTTIAIPTVFLDKGEVASDFLKRWDRE